MREIQVRRLVLSKEEGRIRKTWGTNWSRMKTEEENNNYFVLRIGYWTGYRPNQRRLVHAEFIPRKAVKPLKLECIKFTDNTGLVLYDEQWTIEELLAKGICYNSQYKALIDKAITTNKVVYLV